MSAQVLRRLWRPAFVLALAVAVLIPAAVAQAYWHTGGSGAATATTGTLKPPTGIDATAPAGASVVSVTWVASSGSPAPTGYYVTRTDAGGTVSAACGTSAGSLTHSTSCADTGVALGTYTYRVVAVLRSWTATSASVTATVAKAAQTITFTTTPPAPALTDSTYSVAATATSGLTVTFTSATPAVCTSGGTHGATITLAAEGTCTINANQPGNGTYNAAPQAQQSFTVSAPLVITSAVNSFFGGGVTVSGTGGTARQTVTVRICSGHPKSCAAGSGSLVATITATVAANGTWSADGGWLGLGSHSAQAYQSSPARTSAVQSVSNSL